MINHHTTLTQLFYEKKPYINEGFLNQHFNYLKWIKVEGSDGSRVLILAKDETAFLALDQLFGVVHRNEATVETSNDHALGPENNRVLQITYYFNIMLGERIRGLVRIG
jgi:hypothetical protein